MQRNPLSFASVFGAFDAWSASAFHFNEMQNKVLHLMHGVHRVLYISLCEMYQRKMHLQSKAICKPPNVNHCKETTYKNKKHERESATFYVFYH